MEGRGGQSAERRAQTISQACKGTQTEATEVVREVAISQACKGAQTEATEVVREVAITQTMQTQTSNAATNTEDSKKQPHVAKKARRLNQAKEKTEESQPKGDPPSKSVLDMVRKKAEFGKATDSDEDFKEEMRMGFAMYEFLKNPPIPKLPLLKITKLNM